METRLAMIWTGNQHLVDIWWMGEIMSMSEILKEAKLMQYNLEFCGLGLLPIVSHTDADVARAFCHKRGVGRMKHLDVRHC